MVQGMASLSFGKTMERQFSNLGTLGGYRPCPCCINASGQIAGSSPTSSGHSHAFLWRNDGKPMLDLGTLGRGSTSIGYALNDSGQVVGWSHTDFYKRQHAFVWMNNGTPMKDLGTFGGTTSEANDINASGQVTGWASLTGDSITHAFLWRNDGTKKQDLNTLIDPTDPLKSHVTLTNGLFINDSGDILAQGTDNRTGVKVHIYYRGPCLRWCRDHSRLATSRSTPPGHTIHNRDQHRHRGRGHHKRRACRYRCRPVCVHQRLWKILGEQSEMHG